MTDSNFAFTEEYQAKLLSFMLHDKQFCAIARDALAVEMYANKALQWFFRILGDQDQFHTPVTLKEELVKAVRGKQIKEDDLDKYVKLYGFIKENPTPDEQDHMRTSLGTFIRTQAVKNAIIGSLDLMDEGNKWDEIAESVASACQAGNITMNLGQYYFKDTKNRILRRMSEETGARIPTGITELDVLFNGGPYNKQLSMVAGGTGRGKSIFLQYVARTAILLNKKVIYYTLEMPSDDIAKRCDSMFSQIEVNKVNLFNEDLFKKMSPMVDKYGDSFIIQEYPADTVTVNDIRMHLGQLAASGWKPDLVIVDYLDLLKPHRNYSSVTEELDAITKALHGLAKSLDCLIWTATQLNRAGIVMENPDETAMAGAISKLFTVDICVYLAQTPAEREDEYMRLLVVKNRNGLTGRKVQISTDFSFMTFFRAEGGYQDDES